MSITPDPTMPVQVGISPENQRRDAAIDAVMAERQWPCNPKAAARCGWVAKERDAEAALATLQAELAQAAERIQFHVAMTRDAQEHAALYGDQVLALRARLEAAEKALQLIADIEDQMHGSDWEEIEQARVIARAHLATSKGPAA